MKNNKALVIMKYNKKLQKRLDISINDYRECSEIEIVLNQYFSKNFIEII